MKETPSFLFYAAYVVVLSILAFGSWLQLRSRPTPQEKKKVHDRWAIITGVFVTGFMCLILGMWKSYFGIPLLLAGGLGITFLNLRNTFYCTSCGKRSESKDWFFKIFHCPHCGTQLK
jgi:Na+/H+ antiporter NhaD/arsenite permease-like protein